MENTKNIMSSRPLTLAQIIGLCGFLIVCTFYVTMIYGEFNTAKKERQVLKDRIEYVNDRVTTTTKRNADAIKEKTK